MEKLCIITDQPTKGRLVFKKNKTKIPLSREGKKILEGAIPAIQKQVTQELKDYIHLHAKQYNLERDFIDKAHETFFGQNFNDEGVKYMVYNILKGSVTSGIMYTIVRRGINEHLKGLLEKLDV